MLLEVIIPVVVVPIVFHVFLENDVLGFVDGLHSHATVELWCIEICLQIDKHGIFILCGKVAGIGKIRKKA